MLFYEVWLMVFRIVMEQQLALMELLKKLRGF